MLLLDVSRSLPSQLLLHNLILNNLIRQRTTSDTGAGDWWTEKSVVRRVGNASQRRWTSDVLQQSLSLLCGRAEGSSTLLLHRASNIVLVWQGCLSEHVVGDGNSSGGGVALESCWWGVGADWGVGGFCGRAGVVEWVGGVLALELLAC